MPRGYGTILDIMPVVVDLTFTRGDGWEIDDDVEIDGIYWCRKDGTAGAPTPEHIRERAEKADYLLCNLIDQVISSLNPPPDEGEQVFLLG